jgi:hypothetical protein
MPVGAGEAAPTAEALPMTAKTGAAYAPVFSAPLSRCRRERPGRCEVESSPIHPPKFYACHRNVDLLLCHILSVVPATVQTKRSRLFRATDSASAAMLSLQVGDARQGFVQTRLVAGEVRA